MKVRELLLTNEEVVTISEAHKEEFGLIVEDFSSEIKDITDSVIINPYEKFKSQQIRNFSNKLQKWASRALDDLKPTKKNEKLAGVFKKIINNPRETANQLFKNIMCRKADKDKSKKEDSHIKLWATRLKY